MRVLVVDDQRVVREGIARLISAGIRSPVLVDSAGSTAEALASAARFVPHVIVLDVDLAGEDGLGLMPQLAPPAHVLVLTSHGDAATRHRARVLGAAAFIEKHEPAAVLIGHLLSLVSVITSREQAPGSIGAASQAHPGPSSSGSIRDGRSK